MLQRGLIKDWNLLFTGNLIVTRMVHSHIQAVMTPGGHLARFTKRVLVNNTIVSEIALNRDEHETTSWVIIFGLLFSLMVR